MIFILCTKEDNYTHQIIEWLNLLNINFEKIDLTEKKICDFEIDVSNNDFSLKINSALTIKYSDVSYFLFRDGFIELDDIEVKSSDDKVTNKYLEIEQKTNKKTCSINRNFSFWHGYFNTYINYD